MTDTTTIQITREEKSQLDELKKVPAESYGSVVGRLIAAYENDADEELTEGRVRAIVQEEMEQSQ